MKFLRRRNKYDQHDPTSNRPSDTAIHQQRLRAWRPILTPLPVIILSFIIGVIFTALGIYFFVMWSQTHMSSEHRYDGRCHNYQNHQATCSIKFKITRELYSPVFFYYKIDNHYQNYRQWVSSVSDYQLRGKSYTESDITDCDPRTTKHDTGHQKDVFLPCGLQAANFWKDSLVLSDSKNRTIPWNRADITWKSEQDNRFKNPPKNEKGIWILPANIKRNWKNPDFVNWMRVAPFITYVKLYAVIKHNIKPGTYNLLINDRWPVGRWDGKKSIVLSETNWLGAPNIGLPISFIIVGALSFLLALLFALKHMISPRKLGDTSRIKWDQKPKPPPRPPLWRRLLGLRQRT